VKYLLILQNLAATLKGLVVEVDGGQCTTPTESAPPFTYQCQIDWIGWSGDYWVGNIIFSMADGSSLNGLDAVVLGTVLPDGSVATLNDPIVGCGGTCVQFSKVSKDVTSFSLSVNAP
jgi:hypothetical protein